MRFNLISTSHGTFQASSGPLGNTSSPHEVMGGKSRQEAL